MCTVSAIANESMVLVTMNRDERRSRLEGDMVQEDHLSYPTDQQSSGTWCGVNTHGVIFCLLNRYDAPIDNSPDIISRGTLIPQALEYKSAESASTFISTLNHTKYNGFKLLILSGEGGMWHDWDRRQYSVSEVDDPNAVFASSSSLQPDVIPSRREARYRRWQRDQASGGFPNSYSASAGSIPPIHLLDSDVPPNESIFMVRRDTHTKSICQLGVTRFNVTLDYWPAQTGYKQDKHECWVSPKTVAL